MERLNLRTPKAFNFVDEAETIQPRICFYCISEGATEDSRSLSVELGTLMGKLIEEMRL